MLRRRKQAEPVPQMAPPPAPAQRAVPNEAVPLDEHAIWAVANKMVGEVILALQHTPLPCHAAVAESLAIVVASHLHDAGESVMAIDMLSGLIESADHARQAIIEATRGT